MKNKSFVDFFEVLWFLYIEISIKKTTIIDILVGRFEKLNYYNIVTEN